MRSVKELRKKAASRTRSKAAIYSTSEARANFAEALELVQMSNSILGFDRYGRPVAALVPIGAVLMLAGRGAEVDARTREAIEEAAELFALNMPGRTPAPDAPSPPRPRKPVAKKRPAPPRPTPPRKKPGRRP